jgi:tetratricopeptide (TPR) repeat protein
MCDLEDDIYAKVSELSELGNSHMDSRMYELAFDDFQKALELLPQPKETWDAYTWLKAGTADALFFLKDYELATAELFDAMNGPDGAFNPFVLLRLGQVLYEQNKPNAIEYLCRAYMMEGEKIFADEDGKYIALVKSHLDVDS